MASATLLLPARRRLGAGGDPSAVLPLELRLALGRADHRQAQAGATVQLRRHFRLVPDHWPVAALTRQLDAADAAGARWLRADPAWVVPDMSGARLMGCGQALTPGADDIAALLPALRPLFGDAGCPLDAPHPARWYLRLPEQAPLPAFADPDTALGDDLFEHLPAGDAGRRWRALATEAQVILHQHPWNAERVARGKPPINSLWFWGGGVLPDTVQTPHRQLRSHDALVQALGAAAGIDTHGDAMQSGTPPTASQTPPVARAALELLLDLRHLRDWQALSHEAIAPLHRSLGQHELDLLVLDFEDGLVLSLRRGHRWRVWRRPWTQASARGEVAAE